MGIFLLEVVLMISQTDSQLQSILFNRISRRGTFRWCREENNLNEIWIAFHNDTYGARAQAAQDDLIDSYWYTVKYSSVNVWLFQ